MRMALIFVTGATGLLGGNLVRLLHKEKHRVRCLVRESSDVSCLPRHDLVELVKGDITDASSLTNPLKDVEYVFHCAAVTSLWEGMADINRLVNITGTENIIAAATAAGVKRLIHCSTVDALGVSMSGEPADEQTPWNWDKLGVENPYARSKFEAQQLALEAANTKLDVVVVNPTTMFGAYDLRPSSGQIILLIVKGNLPFYPTGGDNFIDVIDTARGMYTAAEKGLCGACYILGHENVTYKNMFNRIASIGGVSPPWIKAPYQLARIGGWIGDLTGLITGREQTINTSTVKLGALNHYYSSDKAVKELDLPQTPLDSAIERAIAWFKSRGKI